jgi:lysophospholipase L1-like esterase
MIGKRIILALVSITISFAVAASALEIFLRLTATHVTSSTDAGLGPDSILIQTENGRRLRPNADGVIRNHYLSHRDISIKTNSLGFRDEEFPPDKPTNEFRILALGDSVTWGDYLDADKVYVKQLEANLNADASASAIRFRVINAGIGDIGLKEEVDILTEKGLSVKPDIVMVEFFLNDSRPPWGFSGELKYKGWLRRNSLLVDSIYRNLLLRQWVKEKGVDRGAWWIYVNQLNWRSDKNEFDKFVDLAGLDWGAAWKPDSWTMVESQFSKLRQLSDQHGFRVFIVGFPVVYQMETDFYDDTPQQALKNLTSKYNFLYLDLLPMLRPYGAHKDKYYFDQVHPTEIGNELIGSYIAGYLKENILTGLKNQ